MGNVCCDTHNIITRVTRLTLAKKRKKGKFNAKSLI